MYLSNVATCAVTLIYWWSLTCVLLWVCSDRRTLVECTTFVAMARVQPFNLSATPSCLAIIVSTDLLSVLACSLTLIHLLGYSLLPLAPV